MYVNAFCKWVVAAGLAIGLTGGALLAGQSVGEEAAAHSTQKCRSLQASPAVDGRAAPPSRINGREDWDIDYPSQLAPEDLHSSRHMHTAATDTAPARVDVESCAPQHPQP